MKKEKEKRDEESEEEIAKCFRQKLTVKKTLVWPVRTVPRGGE